MCVYPPQMLAPATVRHHFTTELSDRPSGAERPRSSHPRRKSGSLASCFVHGAFILSCTTLTCAAQP